MTHTAMTVDIMLATPKAVMIEEPDGRQIWIPKSVIDDGADLEVGLKQDIEVAKWFADKECLG